MTSPSSQAFSIWREQAAALIRAGLPFDSGSPGGGAPLPEWAPLIAAQTSTEVLAVAIERRAEAARRLVQTRRLARLAMLYPLVVTLVAVLVWIGPYQFFLEQLVDSYREFEHPPPRWLLAADAAPATSFPYVLLALAGGLSLSAVWLVWGFRPWPPRRFSRGGDRPPRGGFRRLHFTWSQATLLDVLAALIEQRRPLPEAAKLAGLAVGEPNLERQLAAWGEALERGEPPATSLRRQPLLPAVIGVALANGAPLEEQAAALRRAAQAERRRAERLARGLTVTRPLCLAVVIGGLAGLGYAVALYASWAMLLQTLAQPPM